MSEEEKELDKKIEELKQEKEELMLEYEEICIIKIENINRELSPYQKCRLIEEVRRGDE